MFQIIHNHEVVAHTSKFNRKYSGQYGVPFMICRLWVQAQVGPVCCVLGRDALYQLFYFTQA